ncbi:hypothetical protein ACS0TY_035513 [Phlomoides rotata]
MLRKEIVSKILSKNHGGAAVFRHRQQRWMVGKAPNRAAVHGSKLPIPNIIPVEEVEMDINRSVEEKEKQRRKMENIVDSHLKKWQVLYVEEIVSSM